MTSEYLKQAEVYDLYNLVGCSHSSGREQIRSNKKKLLKVIHPDKNLNLTETTDKDSVNELFNLINYAFKILDNYITKTIYDKEGHRGLKIYFENIESFQKIIDDYPRLIVENESLNKSQLNEMIQRIMNKLHSKKLKLISLNLSKYIQVYQSIEPSFDFSRYLSFIENDDFHINEREEEKKGYKKVQVILGGKTKSISKTLGTVAGDENNGKINALSLDSAIKNYKTQVNSSEEKKRNTKFKKNFIFLSNINFMFISFFNFKNSNLKIDMHYSNNYDAVEKTFNLSPELKVSNFNNMHKVSAKISKMSDVVVLGYKCFGINESVIPFARCYFDLNNPFKKLPKVKVGSLYRGEDVELNTKIDLTNWQINNIATIKLNDPNKSAITVNFKENFKRLRLDFYSKLEKNMKLYSSAEVTLRESLTISGELSYKLNKQLKMTVTSSLVKRLKKGDTDLYNTLSIGLNLGGFSLRVPLIISTFEDPVSIIVVLLTNVLCQAGGFCFHRFRSLIFD